jgi:hypothetical protein
MVTDLALVIAMVVCVLVFAAALGAYAVDRFGNALLIAAGIVGAVVLVGIVLIAVVLSTCRGSNCF